MKHHSEVSNFTVDRSKIPNSFTYREILSAKNYLKILKSNESKWMEIDAFETNSKRIQDKLNHKFSQADAVIAENKNNKMRRFRIMKNAHDRKKQKVEETQEKKEHEIKINKYWSIIDNNLRDKTVQKKCSSEQKTKIDKVMKNLNKWSKKVEEIKQKKALETFPETKQRLFKL